SRREVPPPAGGHSAGRGREDGRHLGRRLVPLRSRLPVCRFIARWPAEDAARLARRERSASGIQSFVRRRLMKIRGGMLDGDGHLLERDAELLEYLDEPYRGNKTMLTFPFFPPLDGYHRGAILSRLGIHKDNNTTAKTWIDFLDGTGLESTVLYPTAGLAFPSIQDPSWAVPLARAYNDWFTDKFHKASPDRLKAVALVPLQNVPEAVRELRRAVTELGVVVGAIGANSAEVGLRKPLGKQDV